MLLGKLSVAALALFALGGVAATIARQVADPAGTDRRPGDSYPQNPRQAVAIDALPQSADDSAPGSVRGVKKVLESAIERPGWHRRFSIKVRSEQNGPRRVVTQAIIRKDGAKVDFQFTDVLVGQPEDYPGNTTNRNIDDGTSWVTRTTTVGREKRPGL